MTAANIVKSYLQATWMTGTGEGQPLVDAVTGEPVAGISTAGIDRAAGLHHLRTVGGPALRTLTFPQRAQLLADLAVYLRQNRQPLYELSTRTGATRFDARFDVDGGIGVLSAYARIGASLPDATHVVEDEVVRIGKTGGFGAQHLLTSLQGVQIQINAFNFPVWGPLEKLAPAVLAGVPSLIKPAEQTAYVTERLVELILASGILPAATVGLLSGPAGDLLDHLSCQDVVGFTGSAATARRLRAHPVVVNNAVRFSAEADSLNSSILGPDATPDTPEFSLYVKQLVTEMTVKAGQKCTAIRRAFVPAERIDVVIDALTEALQQVTVGNPAREDVRMGALATLSQRDEVSNSLAMLRKAAQLVSGDPQRFELVDADPDRGAFLPPLLLRCDDVDRLEPHEVEAFGPVSTVLPYRDAAEVVELAARGSGSLVGSVVTADPDFARQVVVGAAPYHGRLLVLDHAAAAESTGHGSPLPPLVHGGPGRAGGGEELGGLRSVWHHMQRTAVQGSPAMLRAVTGAHPQG